MDFVADQLADDRKLRALMVVDVFTREALAIESDRGCAPSSFSPRSPRSPCTVEKPNYLFADNGSEFSGRLLDPWACHHKVRIDFSRPGKPTDNCYVETFNASLRDECLNIHWFETFDQAREIIEAWRRDCNESRPRMALEDAVPSDFARRTCRTSQTPQTSAAFGPKTPGTSLSWRADADRPQRVCLTTCDGGAPDAYVERRNSCPPSS